MCRIVGYTKQAYYKHDQNMSEEAMRYEIILQEIYSIRGKMENLGGDKVYRILSSHLPENLRIGRKSTYDLMRVHGLIRHKRCKHVKTTYTVYKLEYHDLIKGLVIDHPNMVWVADITYIRTTSGAFVYLALVTDFYSRKIIGWNLSERLTLDGAMYALRAALQTLGEGEKPIHHSDRGCQYYSKQYTELLKSLNIPISMYTDGDPKNNAVAERLNGIIKNEMLFNQEINGLSDGIRKVSEAIYLYNNERPHQSLDYHTPEEVYHMSGNIKRRWNTNYKRKEFIM
jgi:transposase InsO family protein